MHHRTMHRALLLGAFTAAAGIGVLAFESAACADDKPTAIQQPGGLLDTVLDEITPEPPAAPEPEPTDDPAPVDEPPTDDRPATEPTTPAPDPTETPAPPVDLPPVVEVPPMVEVPPVVDVPPPVVTPPPPPAPIKDVAPAPVVTLPTIGPSPLPGGNAPAAPSTTPALPALPVIGPVPAIGVQLDGTVIPVAAPTASTAALEAPVCEDDPLDVPDRLDLTRVRVPLHRAPPPPAAHPVKPKPCPGAPDGPGPAANQVSVKPPTAPAGDLIGDRTASALAQPALARLGVLRARSHLPTGRTVHLDPRPA